MLPKYGLDSRSFQLISVFGRCTMGVYVINLFRHKACIFQRGFHATSSTFAAGSGCGDMISVARHSVPGNFSVNFRLPRKGALEVFKKYNTGALSHDKTISVDIKRPAGLFRLFIPGRKRLHYCKTTYAQSRNARFSTARNHCIRFTTLDYSDGVTNRMAAGSASCNRG